MSLVVSAHTRACRTDISTVRVIITVVGANDRVSVKTATSLSSRKSRNQVEVIVAFFWFGGCIGASATSVFDHYLFGTGDS